MILVFLCQLLYVFLLGLQSRNVNEGQYLAAATTSFARRTAGGQITSTANPHEP